jgi:hypothetical protein
MGWVVNVTPRPLFSLEIELLYRILRGPQGQSGRVRKISLPLGVDPQTIQPVASFYVISALAVLSIFLKRIFQLV